METILHAPEAARPADTTWQIFAQRLTRLFTGVSLRSRLLFTEQFESMIGSGITVRKALETLAREMQDRKMQRCLRHVLERLEAGVDLADAMEEAPEGFDEMYVSMVRAGMSSGKLHDVLRQLSRYMDKSLDLRGRIVAALSYPVVMLTLSSVILLALLIFVVPKIKDIYQRQGKALPLPTQAILWMSERLREHYLLVPLVFFAAVFLFLFAISTPRGRRLWDTFLLRVWILGPVLGAACMARFSRTLSALLSTNVNILEALALAAETTGNVIHRNAVWECRADVERGMAVNRAMRRTGTFPPTLLQMVAAGEEGGQMADLLARGADYYDRQVEAAVKSLTAVIEPLMLVFMGALIGTIVVCLYLPILSMSQTMG